MNDIFIEAGINHFGSVKEAKIILDFFLKSKFKNLTFMLHNEKFYSSQLKLGINFKGWTNKQSSYFHSFSDGYNIPSCNDAIENVLQNSNYFTTGASAVI